MKTQYRAYAIMKDAKTSEQWRVNIYTYPTKEEAEQAAEKYYLTFSTGQVTAVFVGVHEFYTFTKEEWAKDQYKEKNIENPKQWVTFAPFSTTLIYENVHFEIA